MRRLLIALPLAALALGACGGSSTTDEVTPDSCLRALELADEGFGYAADGMNATGRIFTAVTELDVDAIRAATAEIGTAADGMGPLVAQYHAARDDCRASAD